MSTSKNIRYPHLSEIEDWSILKQADNRELFVQQVTDFAVQKILKKHQGKLRDEIAKSIYLERIRMKEEPWKIDPPNEKSFWRKVGKSLIKSESIEDGADIKKQEEIIRKIVHRYAEEIVGSFKEKTYLFGRKFLTKFFNRLLGNNVNPAKSPILTGEHQSHKRFKIYGAIDHIRELSKKGTIIIVPTHFSNLDSILIGFGLDKIGLPAFTYGAGLNLFNQGILAYFMNRLGAYRVDRRKKNSFYLETLKAVSYQSIQFGTPNLFFPGGTRERSGMIEKRLKLGLLGTVVEAQRGHLQKGNDEKIFVVPLVLGYHFVLEAKSLINQWLKNDGKEKYMFVKDESYSKSKWMKFLWQLFNKGSEIVMTFGKPLDVLGNFVDEQGNSIDKRGRPIDIKGYFTSHGKITTDLQRDQQYTTGLARVIVDRFHKENTVLSSHLVAYTAFTIFKRQNKHLDLYGLLRLPPQEFNIPMEDFEKAISQLLVVLKSFKKKELLKLAPTLLNSPKKVIEMGLKRLGLYHSEEPLKLNKEGDIISMDFKLLLYYHNKLENYNLAREIDWDSFKIIDLERLMTEKETELVV